MIVPYLRQYAYVLKWLGILSVCTFAISIVLVPWLIGLLPADYFIRKKRSPLNPHILHRASRFLLAVLRNMFGAFLLLAGFAMLFLPGQGILTLLLGLTMVDFPGKHETVERLVHRPLVQQGLNWIRAKTNRPPFFWKGDD